METPAGPPIEVRRHPAGRGVDWLGEGFKLFKDAPGNWIVIFIIWFAISMALAAIGLDIVSAFLNPVFAGGLMLGCRSLVAGSGLRVGHLFEAFRGNRVGTLLLFVVLQIALGLAIVAVAAVFAFMTIGGLLDAPEAALKHADLMAVLLLVLLVVALSVPLAMMSWFAPALIVLRGAGAWDAMLLSFQGCLRNWIPFLLYGLVALAMIIVAVIPLMLGLIVAIPVLTASVYTSYRDIFPEPEPAVAPQAAAV